MMDEMEKEICDVIAKYVPFSGDDIFNSWMIVKSFDCVLRGVELSRACGLATVTEAIKNMVESYFEENQK